MLRLLILKMCDVRVTKYEIIKDIFRPGLGIEVDEQAVRRFHVPIKN